VKFSPSFDGHYLWSLLQQLTVKIGAYINHKILRSFHEPLHMPTLLLVYLHHSLFTPVLTNERQTPTIHNIQPCGLRVSGSFALSLQLSRRTHRFKTQTHPYRQNTFPKTKACFPKLGPSVFPKLSEQQRNYHEGMQSSISLFLSLFQRSASHMLLKHHRATYRLVLFHPTLHFVCGSYS